MISSAQIGDLRKKAIPKVLNAAIDIYLPA